MKNASSKIFFATGLLCLLIAVLVVNAGHAEWSLWNPWGGTTDSGTDSVPAPPDPPSTLPVVSQEEEIVRTVKNAEPAVVSVIITKDVPKMEQIFQGVPLGGDLRDPFFQQFRIQIPQLRQNGTEKKEVGGGTAFFVTGDGLLMTNKHVVADTQAKYTVLLNDERKLPAKVVARDPSNDIALLEVEGSAFHALTLAESDALNLGQTAIAIGNALGEFRNTVSVGVVSGLQRSITAGNALGGNTERLDQIIQTDAAINSGNSGGPLLDSKGEVIGMNTAIATGGQNVSFALPVRELRRVLSSYQKNGRIVIPFLGVRYTPITPELKDKNHLAYDDGVLLVRGQDATEPAVVPGSPADKAGLTEHDVLLEADGQKLTGAVSLSRIIQSKAPGDSLRLKIDHQGTMKDITVTLEELRGS